VDESKQLVEFVHGEILRKHKAKSVIIMGDFNSSPHDPAGKYLREHFNDTYHLCWKGMCWILFIS
jgi:endonuclease/exonuclease/phosphatase family metal-dependent hydrolase